MSGVKIKFKLNQEQSTIVQDFAKQVGLTLEQFCKQAVFYSINDSFRRANEAVTLSEGSLQNAKSESGNVEGVADEVRIEPGADTDALPNKTDTNASGEA